MMKLQGRGRRSPSAARPDLHGHDSGEETGDPGRYEADAPLPAGGADSHVVFFFPRTRPPTAHKLETFTGQGVKCAIARLRISCAVRPPSLSFTAGRQYVRSTFALCTRNRRPSRRIADLKSCRQPGHSLHLQCQRASRLLADLKWIVARAGCGPKRRESDAQAMPGNRPQSVNQQTSRRAADLKCCQPALPSILA